MKSLIWKDYRLARPLLLVGAVLIGSAYLLGAIMEIWSSWPALPTAKAWGGMLVSYGTISLYLAACVTGLLGGHAIACERADRTAHFLAYLPPTKTRILASKLAVAAIATAVVWAWLLLSVMVLAPRLNGAPIDYKSALFDAAGGAQLCALTFGTGWLGSAIFESTTIPIIMGLSSPIALGLVLVATLDLLGVPRFEMGKWSGLVGACVGAVAFALGTWRYYRRVGP